MSGPVIPLAGVIGHPVAHSRSPRLHRHWLDRYGIEGYYVPMDVTADALAEVLRALPRMGFRGVNVTIPHKELALSLADVVSDRAALVGAANTLTFGEGGRIHADNTDGYGFIANIADHVPDWNPKEAPALVLGAGGAARAVVAALLEKGVPEIRLANRTEARARALRDLFGARVKVVDWIRASDAVEDAGLVVNTTSLGMEGRPALKLSLDRLSPGAIVTDVVYTPLKTPLIEEAARRGAIAVDGLGMLLHQAAPGFERWFDKRPEVDEDLRRAVLAP